jgi:hypothetical protein
MRPIEEGMVSRSVNIEREGKLRRLSLSYMDLDLQRFEQI